MFILFLYVYFLIEKYNPYIYLINNITLQDKEICLKEWSRYTELAKKYNINCCKGLKPLSDENYYTGKGNSLDGDGCFYNAFSRGSVCLPCGDGICGDNENYCNCREDCPRPEDKGKYVPLFE